MSFFLLSKLLKHLQRKLVAIKSSLILLVKRLKHKKRQYFKADNNHGASFAFFHLVNFLIFIAKQQPSSLSIPLLVSGI
ncbi:hypothetical protein [Wolbachia endosymbiont (group A) of Hylaeus communis]|uniref:hypothetical protein n=1 Tax=Wolbachia endosymbiont (group A) of Hylaeus communis TaxID=2954018 RepID=UPI0022303446|nr:hypothetical protein [Wolbachia endosymbiont (group A) of Hylaeus communis]